ncbi:MAG: hypothetical protein K9M75_06715 [Phycisphaerae bacterium]|nr:hypothetical protein [Phycisphaerae bacterium]
MTKNSEKIEDRKNVSSDAAVDDFVSRLSNEHKMLVVLKAQLYGGSWEAMLDDLNNRLAGKPYIFKLVNRINEDVERIEILRGFEVEHGIDLADYVDLT